MVIRTKNNSSSIYLCSFNQLDYTTYSATATKGSNGDIITKFKGQYLGLYI